MAAAVVTTGTALSVTLSITPGSRPGWRNRMQLTRSANSASVPCVGFLLASLTLSLSTSASPALSMAAESSVGTEQLSPCDDAKRNPNAPAELDQFGFLIGNFDITARSRKPDGTWADTVRKAYWEGRWILGGTAIVDYWYDQPPIAGTQPGRGVNVRMYRPETKQWTNMWQHTGLAEVRTLLSEVREDGLMHMWASHPDTSKRRRMRFETSSPDQWVRIEEWSRDEGKTWFEVARLEATRAPCPWRPPSD